MLWDTCNKPEPASDHQAAAYRKRKEEQDQSVFPGGRTCAATPVSVSAS